MSSGHPFDFDDAPSAHALRDWRKIVSEHPKVLALQKRYLSLPNNHRFDMPYLAGYSVNRNRIFFDRHMPYIQTIGKRRININECIKIHEATESALIDSWAEFATQLHLDRSPQYEFAHHIATAVEYQAVESLDIKLDDYRKCLRPQIKAASHEKLEKMPSDFDTFPLKSDPKLLAHVESVMKKDKSSRLGFAAAR